MTRKTILIVDDKRDILDSYTRLFNVLKYNVKTALSGKEGLEIVASCAPDLVVTDYHMPRMDGYEFSKRFKKNRQTKGIIIVGHGGFPQDKREYLDYFRPKVWPGDIREDLRMMFGEIR